MALDWDRVAEGLRSGRYNLLLGAGVSLDSQSGSSNPLYKGNLPTVSKLHEDLFSVLKTMRSGSSLNRLYRNLTPDQSLEHITKRFANCTAGPTVRAIPNFRWKRIFTLNVDDALERAYQTASAPMQEAISVNFRDVFFDNHNKQSVQIVHLHGYAQKPEDGYVFDIKEYMQTISDNSVWAHVLGNIIRSEPFFVMGTSLEEPDITYFLADRDAASDRSDRPPSVLVEPNPDPGTDKDCGDYSLNLHKGTALEFLNHANAKVPNRPTVRDIIHDNLGDLIASGVEPSDLAIFHSDFERVPATAQQNTMGGANFALGHSATWADLQSDCDVPRGPEANRLSSLVKKARALDTRLLLGEPGAGKSTILKRIALEKTRDGFICFWRRSPGRIQLPSTINVLRTINKPSLIFVDNFADHTTEILELRRLIAGTNVVFVGAERTYRFEHVRRVLGAETIETCVIGSVGLEVAKRLITSYIDLGLSETKKGEEQALARKIVDEQIAVACCRIINKFAPIEAVIDRSITDATEKSRRCYLIVSLASHCLRDG
ncbi:MAG: SIR2 family protein, partial [Hyphomicrobium sp.]